MQNFEYERGMDWKGEQSSLRKMGDGGVALMQR